MRKFIIVFLSGFLFLSPISNAAWNNTLPGDTNISDVDARVTENYAALESLLSVFLSKNLVVSRTSSSIVRIQSDYTTLQKSSDLSVRATSVDVSCNITSSGANGLDSGSEASSTWYYVHAIRKSSDGTLGCLLSTSATSPSLPTGYDQSTVVSAARNDSSSNFVDFIQDGDIYVYRSWQAMASGTPGVGSWTSIDITSYVPSTLSTHAFGSTEVNTGALYLTNDSTISVSSGQRNEFVLVSSGSYIDSQSWNLHVLTANTLYYAANAAGKVYVQGFYINKLGG